MNDISPNQQLRLSPERLAEVVRYVETLFADAQPGSLKADTVLALAELETRRRGDDTADLRKALGNLYGVAQDLHSRLQGMTSVAETQRFMPAILAAHTALEGIVEPSACPKCDAVRKLGLTSCFEHKQPENSPSGEIGRFNVKTYTCECVGGCKGQMSLPRNFRCRRREVIR